MAQKLVIVTGLSGAGKSSVLKAFEDTGFHVVDNLPLKMIETLIAATDSQNALALGLDQRTVDFSAQELLSVMKALQQRQDLHVELLFVDATQDILVQRFSETRRRHPLSDGRNLREAIQLEFTEMSSLRHYVDSLIDTSNRKSGDLKAFIQQRYQKNTHYGQGLHMITSVMSFGYSMGVPKDADLIFDVRFLKNPHYDPVLKPLTGRDARVVNFIRSDENFQPFLAHIYSLLEFLLPKYKAEGKSYLTIAFGCTGGKHRSIATAETVAAYLSKNDALIQCLHRDN